MEDIMFHFWSVAIGMLGGTGFGLFFGLVGGICGTIFGGIFLGTLSFVAERRSQELYKQNDQQHH